MIINVEDNLDFTQERIDVLNRIRLIREDLELRPAEFLSLVGIVSEFADDGTVFPSEWKICEDVLFENLARVYRAGPAGLGDVERWMLGKLRRDFCGDTPVSTERRELIADSVDSYADVSCPTRWFRVYMEVYLAITQDVYVPTFCVCTRMLRWISEDTMDASGGPPGGE